MDIAWAFGEEKEKEILTKCLHDIVKVSWIDADEESGWQEYNKEAAWVIHTIGFLVEKPKLKTDFVVLANSHLPDTGVWSGLCRIPRGMVLSITTVVKNTPCGGAIDENTGNPRHTNKAERTD